VAAVAAAMVLLAGPGLAQTPDAVCAADSLYLISPDMVDLHLETTGVPGLTISWPNLDQTDATCFSLSDTENLGFEVDAGGGFGDRVDRRLVFSTENDGEVGGPNDGNITIRWRSLGGAANGILAGEFNLSNNGGLWSYDRTGGESAWRQVNNGLPMSWPRTNVVALAQGAGDFMVAGFTRGNAIDSESAGLFAYNGTNWSRLIAEGGLRITAVAISPADNNSFAVGTDGGGLFVTDDGGVTFTQWTLNLEEPATVEPPSRFLVSALNWDSSRLLVFMPSWGLFISADGGNTFSRSEFMVRKNLDVTDPTAFEYVLPIVEDIAVDPTNPNRIVTALQFHGAFESTDGGGSWHDLYGDLVVIDPDSAGVWINSGLNVLVDETDPQVILLGVSQKGLYRSGNGGQNWHLVADELQPENRARLLHFALSNRPGLPGEMLAMEDGWRLLHSMDSGVTWSEFSPRPLLNDALFIVTRRDNSGDFVLGTSNGGIYETGTVLELSDTYSTSTSPELRDLDLGLTMTFGEGTVARGDAFELVAQTFQGWAVWRGAAHDPDNMTMIGLYDRVNPEDCFEGFCGDNSLEVVPACFAAKRAACFDLSNPDTLRFFDAEVYNGLSYVYAVTSFDYGNMALTTAQNNTNEMLFSARWSVGDTLTHFPGAGNRTRINVNQPAASAAATPDNEIYAFPNPVRLGAGIPGGEGRLVTFTNLPEGARVRVFTTAGDDIINLGPDNQTGGQIYWRTVNRDGEDVSAGVYLYKVEMPQREDYWGRIVVIR